MKEFKRLVAMLLLVGILCSFAVPVTFATEDAQAYTQETSVPEEAIAETTTTTVPEESTAATEVTFPDAYPYNVKYEEYLNMSEEEQLEFYQSFPSHSEFKAWRTAAKKVYDDSKLEVEIGGDGTIRLEKDGTIGDNLTWNLKLNGTLTISGTGDMVSWTSEELPWLNEQNLVKQIIIEEGITSIGNNAFYNWTSLTGITIPESVTRINAGAFAGCSSLTDVYYGGSPSRWEQVLIEENNDALVNATIHYGKEDTLITVDPSSYPESEHNYADYLNETKTFCYPSARKLTLTFSDSTQTEQNCDHIYLYDGFDNLIAQYTGAQAAGQTVTISGDTFKVKLTTDGSVTYYGYSFSSIVADISTLTELSIVQMPAKTSYLMGESLNTKGLVLNAAYSDGSAEELTESFTISGFDNTVPGEQTVTVTFMEKTVSFTVTVRDVVLTGIALDTQAAKTAYWAGEALDTSGLIVTAICADGTTETIDSGYTVSGFNTNTSGTQILTVTYGAFSATYEITVTHGGTCGENLTWTVDDNGTLTISGTGAMDNWNSWGNYAPWYGDRYSIKNVIIQEGINTIGGYAFYDCYNLQSVTIPGSVTWIYDNAFYFCGSLTSVTVPNGVTTIGTNAFMYCRGLTEITIPDSVTAIGDQAFYGCNKLTGIWVDENNPNYSSDSCGVLFNKNKTTLRLAPGGLKGNYTIPDGVTEIGYNAFYECTSLTSITIPASVTTIGFQAFYRCNKLTGFWVDENNPNYSSDSCGVLFNKDKSMLIQAPKNLSGSYTIPDSVTQIGYNAFYECTGLTYVTIPESVTDIGDYAFRSCENLTEITIPDSVTRIGYYAFYYCTGLTVITIPASVTGIGYEAFRYTSLKTAYLEGTADQWTSINLSSAFNSSVSIVYLGNAPQLESLEFTPVSIMEATYGEWVNGVFCYNVSQLLQKSTYTATFTDGTVLTGNGSGFNHNGVWYEFEKAAEQSSDTPWLGGNTYNITASLLGQTAEVSVTIEASPLVSLEFMPVLIEKETCGYWNSYYVNSQRFEYFYYENWYLREKANYTATFCDGTVLTGTASDGGFYYKGIWYGFDYEVPSQSYEDRWLPGNTYAITFTVLGKQVQCPVTICEATNSGRYTYLAQNGMVVITDCTLTDTVLQIPDTIDGLPVVGITSLGAALKTAQEIVIPNSVRMLSSNVFRPENGNDIPLQKLTLGSGVSNLSASMLQKAKSLEKIVVDASNPNYSSVDGVVYNKDFSKLIVYPPAKTGMHYVPDSVTDVNAIVENPELYSNIHIQFGEGVKDYVIEDGVIYSADMTCVFMATGNAPANYVMPDTVTEIIYKAFSGSNFTEVTISGSVTEIVYKMFAGSKKLEKVNIPMSVITIDQGAFEDCTSLKSADIPCSVQEILGDAYYNCEALEAVNITDLEAWCNIQFSDTTANPLHIAKNLYVNEEKVTDLVIPDSVTGICYYTFTYMDVNTVTLPEGLTYIGWEAFANSTLTSINMPESITDLGSESFYGCKNLKSIQLNEGMTFIPSGCFAKSGLKSIEIPQTIERIGSEAFAESALSEVIFHCKEAIIGRGAFTNCPIKELDLEGMKNLGSWETFTGTLITNLKIPDTVTQISYRVFAFNDNLVSVTIPDSVENIHPSAFEGDDNLSHVLYMGTQAQWAAIGNCDGDYNGVASEELNNATIHYEALGDEVTVEQTCTTISLYCSICDKWETVTKPKAGHNLVDGICTDCGHEGDWGYVIDEDAGTVTITEYYGEETDIKIPESIKGYPVTAVSKYTFRKNNKIVSVEFPGSVTEIADYAFYDCDNLENVIINEGTTVVGDSAFLDCDKLKGIELPDSIITIGEYAFAYSGLRNIIIPQSVTEIAYCTFCSADLSTITIPESVTSIGDGAFQYVWNLETVCFTGSRDQWEMIKIGDVNGFLLEADIQFMKSCQHSRIEDGVCATCGEVIGSMLTDSQGNKLSFATFQEALEAAQEGQTLTMHLDAEHSEMVLPGGVDLDLNGYTLTVDSVLTFNGGSIIDNSQDVNGLLKINDFDGNMISENNSQLPVYDKASRGFRFFEIQVESQAVTGKDRGNPKYWFKINTRNFARFNDLVQAGSKMLIQVKMTWDGQSEPSYAAADLAFTKQWAQKNKDNDRVCITVCATGGENLENFQLIPCITANGVEISGEEME